MGICIYCAKPKHEHHGAALWCTSPEHEPTTYDRYKEALPCESPTILETMQEEDRSARLQRLQQAKTELEQAEVVDPEAMMKQIENERRLLFGHLPIHDAAETFDKVLGQPDPLPHLQLMNVRLCDLINQLIENGRKTADDQYKTGYKKGNQDGRLSGLRDAGADKWGTVKLMAFVAGLIGFGFGSVATHYLLR